MKFQFLLASLLYTLLCAITAHAFPGKVVRIADGDTVTVLTAGNQQVKVRLYGIDCPESRQAFGNRAKQYLASLIAGKTVDVQECDVDRYGRTVGIIKSGGQVINREMVEQGYAWVYPQHCKRPECRTWKKDEAKAMQARRGLWVDNDPVPPWAWRKMQRTKHKK